MPLSDTLLENLQSGEWEEARRELDRDTRVTDNPEGLFNAIEQGIEERAKILDVDKDDKLVEDDLKCMIEEVLIRGIQPEIIIKYSFNSESNTLNNAIAQVTPPYLHSKTQFENPDLYKADLGTKKYFPHNVQLHRDEFSKKSTGEYLEFVRNRVEQAENDASKKLFIEAAFYVYFDEHPPTEDVGRLDLDLLTQLIGIFKENRRNDINKPQYYPDVEEVMKPDIYRDPTLNQDSAKITPTYGYNQGNLQLVPDIYHQIWERGLQNDLDAFINEKLQEQADEREVQIDHREGYEQTFKAMEKEGIDPVTIIYHIIYDDRTPEGEDASALDETTKNVIDMVLDRSRDIKKLTPDRLVNFAEKNNKMGVMDHVLKEIKERQLSQDRTSTSDDTHNHPDWASTFDDIHDHPDWPDGGSDFSPDNP